MDMAFDFSEIAAMARAYDGGERIVREEIERGMTRAVITVEADAKRLVPTDTHTLQRSITHEVQASGGSITGRAGTNLVYGPVVEYGRTAGAAMPPAGALLGWMSRKGIDARFEYLVRRAIGRRGTRPRPFLKPALEANRKRISDEFGTAVPQRIFRRLAVSRG